METTVARPGLDAAPPLWRRLLVATSIGWVIGIVAGVALIIVVESLGLQALQSPLILGVALGVGWQQSRALRPILAGSRARWLRLGRTSVRSGLSRPAAKRVACRRRRSRCRFED